MVAWKLLSTSFRFASNSRYGQPAMTKVRPSFVGQAANPRWGRIRLEAAVERQPAPVAASGQQLRLLVVFLRVHRICDERVPAVRSDDHAGALGDGWAAPLVTADADDAAMLEHEAVDRELLAYPDSRRPRRRRAARPTPFSGAYAIGAAGVAGWPLIEGAEVELVGVDGRAARRDDAPEEGPIAASAATPGGWIMWAETVSLGNVARSTSSTRWFLRAQAASPSVTRAQRAPTTIASYARFARLLLVWMPGFAPRR